MFLRTEGVKQMHRLALKIAKSGKDEAKVRMLTLEWFNKNRFIIAPFMLVISVINAKVCA